MLKIDTVEEQLDDVLGPERLTAALAGLFGSLATLLACLGVYGVISYTVARRTNEMGVRMALGAMPRDVLGMVFKESIFLGLAGIAIGLPVSLGAARLFQARLFGVPAADPLIIGVATLLMIAVAVLAGFVPALRAAKVDPMVALRYE